MDYLFYLLDRKLGGSQSRSRRCGVENNLALSGIKPRPRVVRQHNWPIMIL
jgi:hypothetical protein